MSVVEYNGKNIELKFTFNSFRYMEDLDLTKLEEENLESHPFTVVPILTTLMIGALNHNPSLVVPEKDVVAFMENYVAEGNDISELLGELLQLLEDSNFFKALQKKAETQEKA